MKRAGHPGRRSLAAVALVVLAALATTWYLRPELRPAWLPFDLPVSPSAAVTLYRWQDDAGNWVVSDEPPPEGVPFETVTTRHDTNVVPAFDDDG